MSRNLLLLLVASGCTFSAPAARLSGLERDSSGVRLNLNVEPNAVYLVERSTNLVDWTVALRSDALSSNRVHSCPELPNASVAFYRALRTNEPLFRFALAARNSIDLNGHNLIVDSFDSGAPSNSMTADRGYVACNESLIDSIGVGAAFIHGRLHLGSNGTAAVGANGVVGDASVHNDPASRGKVLPGWVTNDAAFSYPEVTLPFTAANARTPFRDWEHEGVRYDYAFLGRGDYWIPEGGTVYGKIYCSGTNRVVCRSSILLTGISDRMVVRTNSTLELYMDAPQIRIAGMGLVNPGAAKNCFIFGTTNCTSIGLGGNADMTAAIYAPQAFVQMNGAGTTTTNSFSGAMVSRGLKLNGNFRFHFDEDLLRSGPSR